MLLIVLLLRLYSFDGRFNSIERGLMNRDILKYKIYGGDRFSNQLTINIYTDSINFQGIKSSNKVLTDEQIYDIRNSTNTYISTIRKEKSYFARYKNYKSKSLKYINRYYKGYLNRVEFEFFANKDNKVLAINTYYDGKRDSEFYFKNDTLIRNYRRRMTVDGTYMIGMEGFTSWKTERSGCQFSGNRLIHAAAYNKGFWNYPNQRLKAAYFYKGVAEYLIHHDSINCTYKIAKYIGSDIEFNYDFQNRFNKEIMSQLLEYEHPIELSAKMNIDSTGELSELSVRYLLPWNAKAADSLIYKTVKGEIHKVLLTMKWNPAYFKCKPINTKKRIFFNYVPKNSKKHKPLRTVWWRGL